MPVRKETPSLILSSAGERSSSFEASPMSALLSFVLCYKSAPSSRILLQWRTNRSIGAYGSLEMIVTDFLYPCSRRLSTTP